MSIVEVASEIPRPWRIIKPRALTIDPTICREMAEQYRLLCVKRPFVNRYTAASNVCAGSFPDLDLRSHPKKQMLVELRQQLMAFCRAVSARDGQINSWAGIAKVFNCTHANVIYAHRVYGMAMEAQLRE
jgi:hypothetical protein